jgi:hypothetical protein
MPPLDEDGEPATGSTQAGRDRPPTLHALAVLHHMHARNDVIHLRNLHRIHLPSSSFSGEVPLDKEAMLKKIGVSTEIRPDYVFPPKPAFMLWRS